MTANPFAAPSAPITQGSLWPNENEGDVLIDDPRLSKSQWTLRFHRQSVELLDKDGAVVQSAEKSAFIKKFSFAPVGAKCIAVKLGSKKVLIKLSDAGVLRIIRLLGIDEWKQEYGKTSAKGMLAWGVVIVCISLLVCVGTTQWPIHLLLLETLWVAAGCLMIVNGILARRSLRSRTYVLQIISNSLVILCIGINMFMAFHWLQALFFVVLAIGIPLAMGNLRLFKALEREVYDVHGHRPSLRAPGSGDHGGR